MEDDKTERISSSTPLINENNIQDTGMDDIPLLDLKISRCSKYCTFLRTLTIEPAIFLYMFSYSLGISCLSNLIMDKACLYYFNYTKEVCNNLSAHEIEKQNLEMLANNYVLYSNLFSVVGAFMMVFIAPWSEKYGRKPPMLFTCLGGIVSDAGIIVCVLYFESSLSYLVLCRLPTEITGGFICFLALVYSHGAEVTTEKYRTLKYTTIEIAFMTALSLGGITGGMIFRYCGYFYVYLLEVVLHGLAWLWILFVVEETAGEEMSTSWKVKGRNFFRIESITKSWKATVRPRENNKRAVIWMYLVSMCVVVLTYEMYYTIGYIYSHELYNWDPAQYNTVNTAYMLSAFLMMMIIAPVFLKVWKLSDPMLGILGSVSMAGKNTLLAFANYNILIYHLGNAAGFLIGFASLSIRTGLSKITSKEETALVFSFLATLESLFPMIGTVAITKIFNATIDVHPSVVFLSSVTFHFIPLMTFIWLYQKSKKSHHLSINSNE